MQLFEFGTAPQAKQAGYSMAGTVCATKAELTEKHKDQDVIFVFGPAIFGRPGVHEFARFVRNTGDAKVPTGIPARVQWSIDFHAEMLKEHAAALKGVQRARGNGHILSLELADRKEAIQKAYSGLSEIHDMAVTNDVLDHFLERVALHPLPDLGTFGLQRQFLPEWVQQHFDERMHRVCAMA